MIHNKDPVPSPTAPQYPPRSVEAVVMNGTAIRVMWKPPQDFPDKLSGMGYIIYYTPVANAHFDLNRWTSMHIGDFNRYDLSGLKEETEYGIKVVLQTYEGRSPPSDMFIIRTGKAGTTFFVPFLYLGGCCCTPILTCFVLYLKVITTFMKIDICILL